MGGPGKFLELLDFPKFALPNVLSLDAPRTALNLSERWTAVALCLTARCGREWMF
jgi:hypothetical protein